MGSDENTNLPENMASGCLAITIKEMQDRLSSLSGDALIEEISKAVIESEWGARPSFWFKTPLRHLLTSSIWKLEALQGFKVQGIPDDLHFIEGFMAFEDRSFLWFKIIPEAMRGALELATDIEDVFNPYSELADVGRLMSRVGYLVMPNTKKEVLQKANEIERVSITQMFHPFGAMYPIGKFACANKVREFASIPFANVEKERRAMAWKLAAGSMLKSTF